MTGNAEMFLWYQLPGIIVHFVLDKGLFSRLLLLLLFSVCLFALINPSFLNIFSTIYSYTQYVVPSFFKDYTYICLLLCTMYICCIIVQIVMELSA